MLSLNKVVKLLENKEYKEVSSDDFYCIYDHIDITLEDNSMIRIYQHVGIFKVLDKYYIYLFEANKDVAAKTWKISNKSNAGYFTRVETIFFDLLEEFKDNQYNKYYK